MNELKRCSKCGEDKPHSEFYKHPTTKDRLQSQCKECQKKPKREKEPLPAYVPATKVCSFCKVEKSADEFYHRWLAKDGLTSRCKACYHERRSPQPLPPTKTCTRCGSEHPRTSEFFGKHASTRDGLQSWCRFCTGRRKLDSDEDPSATKTCTMCQQTKPIAQFYRHNKTRDRLQSNCIECQRIPPAGRGKRQPPKETTHKYCRGCAERKLIGEFYTHPSTADGLSTYCIVCSKAKSKESTKKRRYQGEKDFSYDRRWYREVKERLKCAACGCADKDSLHFHHRNREEKLFDISNEIGRRPLDEIKDEMRKCDVLCGPCHRKAHSKAGLRYGRYRRFRGEVLEIIFEEASYCAHFQTVSPQGN